MKDHNKDQKKNQLKSYVKYSGLAAQMVFTMILFAWIGMKLDEYYEVKGNLFTVFLLLFGVFASIYFAIRELLKGK